MMFEASVQMSFSAAHRLRAYKGKCENIHGHNWKAQINVIKEKLDKHGMVMDFTELKHVLWQVLAGLDHKLLNDTPYFKKINPTSENIARYIYIQLCKKLKIKNNSSLRICVWETENSCATYYE